MEIGTTLNRFITEQQRQHPGARGAFTQLLSELGTAAKIISREVNKAGLAETMGITGRTNVHGEEVQKLDAFANATVIRALDHTGHLAAMASEEMEEIYPIPAPHPRGNYILVFDPVDGSSNIDVNVSIGTIFSIFRKRSPGEEVNEADSLRPGDEQVCAGYIIYGSSTMLVYTTGQGTHGFTLDPSLGEFLLSHENIRMPRRGAVFSTNEGNYGRWEDGVRRYVDHLKGEGEGRPYAARYIGSLVADFHRNLLKGGVFLYPADSKSPNGKLRLLYEAAPLAFIAEQAGGAASDGQRRIMEIVPDQLHQRVPFFIGCADDVEEAEAFIRGDR